MRIYLAHGLLDGCAGVVLFPLFHIGLYEEIVRRRGTLGLILFVYKFVQPGACRRHCIHGPCLEVLTLARLVAVLVDVTGNG